MRARRVSLVFMVAVGLAVMAPTPASAAFITFEVGGNVTEASIQPTVDGFRAALGDPNNANLPGPLGEGRREINWDGGGAVDTALAPTPFAGFQNIRGALFTTPGTGFAQVPVDLVDELFNNPTYAGEFNAFSEVRLFTPIASNITDVTFFIPGTGGTEPATVSGFGAVFTDVDAAASSSSSSSMRPAICSSAGLRCRGRHRVKACRSSEPSPPLESASRGCGSRPVPCPARTRARPPTSS